MANDNPKSIPLNPSVIDTDADRDALSLRNFNIILLVEPDGELVEPTQETYDEAVWIWESILDELQDVTDDPRDVLNDQTESSEIDIIIARIGSAGAQIFFETGDAAYVIFPQGMIQPYYDVLRHLGYWLTGVHNDHPHWKVVVVGATDENEIARVANLADELGMETTILERYTLSAELFIPRLPHDENPPSSYGEITADKLLKRDE